MNVGTKIPAVKTPAMIGESVSAPDPDRTDPPAAAPVPASPPEEIGGRDGPDPTRYGDWEKNGRCIDF
ncbi:DUF1674 domain-containing protein [Luteimonas huabeiensis]|uniref:DUF1674 domain-containing protein n=1 Tax=Luteimonas huabeiensis TaxID=1244513 RepID=UPI001F171AEA|nr:DUF1674 domain-containing protein [Luteimonas huabeiensis]